MAYELENIEVQISKNISVAASDNIEFDVPMFLEELDSECFKVKRAFRHQVVSFENERLIKRYFHFHQESLIALINTLHAEQQLNTAFLHSILERLAGLLQYLEEHFPEYFNQDMKMPTLHQSKVKTELNGFCKLMSAKFKATNIDPTLVNLLIGCVNSQSEGAHLTFRQFYYFKLLRINIESIDSSEQSVLETIDVIKVLLHCNFNSEHFYSYLIKYINCIIARQTTLHDQVDQLTYFLKFSYQESSNQAIAFRADSAPINMQISEWLSQELMYLKTKQQLLPTISAEEIVPSEFKLNFDISVSHLAFLFRAFIEAGVIQNKNTSELIRFLSKYVKTKKQESISFESFRIKYYSVESGTKDAVKKTLQSVLNFISNFNH